MIVDAGLRVYDVLRTHSDGTMLHRVPWRELTAALATALRGSLTERLQLIFRLFDPCGKGQIDVPHMMSMASMLFKLRLLDPTAADKPIAAQKAARRAASRRLASLSTTSPDLFAAARTAAARDSGVTPTAPKTPAPNATTAAATRERGGRSVDSDSDAAGGGATDPGVSGTGWSEPDSCRYSEGYSVRDSADLGPSPAMSRATAPVSTSTTSPAGPFKTPAWTVAQPGGPRQRYRRGSCDPRPPPATVGQPRLRRMATVCGVSHTRDRNGCQHCALLTTSSHHCLLLTTSSHHCTLLISSSHRPLRT